MSAHTPSQFALIARHREIAQQVSDPDYTAADYVLFYVAALALTVIAVTSGAPL